MLPVVGALPTTGLHRARSEPAVARGSVIGRQVAIMEVVLEGDLPSLSDVANRTGLPLSTTHRLVANLCAQGLLRKTPWLTYLPGPRLLNLVHAGVRRT
jgi:DNA-binding IclR family transcriptional regulator